MPCRAAPRPPLFRARQRRPASASRTHTFPPAPGAGRWDPHPHPPRARDGMDPDRPPDYLPAHHYARQKGCCRSVSSSSPIIAVHIHVYLAFASHRMRLRQDRTWMISAQPSSSEFAGSRGLITLHQRERQRDKRNVRMDEMRLVVLIFVGKATGRATRCW